MTRKASLLALLATLEALALAGLWLTPSGALGDVEIERLVYLGLPLPWIHAFLAWGLWRAKAGAAALSSVPQTLAVRFPTEEPVPDGAATGVALCATMIVGNVEAFFASLGATTWSDAWSCAHTGPGETSCNLTTGAWSVFFFGVGCVVVFLCGMGLLGWGLAFLRGVRRRSGPLPPVVECGSRQLFAEVPFEFRVVQVAREPGASVDVRLRCQSITRHTDHEEEETRERRETLFDRTIGGATAAREGVFECRGRAVLPPEASPSHRTEKHEVRWELSVRSTTGGRSETHETVLEVSPSTPDAWPGRGAGGHDGGPPPATGGAAGPAW